MDVDPMFRVLARRAAPARHDRSSPAQMATHQAPWPADLRRHPHARSPLYARHHAGMRDAPLATLPA